MSQRTIRGKAPSHPSMGLFQHQGPWLVSGPPRSPEAQPPAAPGTHVAARLGPQFHGCLRHRTKPTALTSTKPLSSVNLQTPPVLALQVASTRPHECPPTLAWRVSLHFQGSLEPSRGRGLRRALEALVLGEGLVCPPRHTEREVLGGDSPSES